MREFFYRKKESNPYLLFFINLTAKGKVKTSFYDFTSTSIADILAHPSFPDSPTKTGRVDHLDVTRNIGTAYALRIQSYFIAPQSGLYKFVAACDDQCKIYLSTDDKEANKKEIIHVEGWTYYNQWDK